MYVTQAHLISFRHQGNVEYFNMDKRTPKSEEKGTALNGFDTRPTWEEWANLKNGDAHPGANWMVWVVGQCWHCTICSVDASPEHIVGRNHRRILE